MIRRTLMFTVSTLFVVGMTQAAFSQSVESVDMHLKIQMQKSGGPPEIIVGRVFFSYSDKAPVRRVGIAFQHENFNKIHPFIRNEHNVFVLNYSPPAEIDRLVYRLVVDGLWITDPNNPNRITLPGDVSASVFDVPEKPEKQNQLVTDTRDGQVTFRFSDKYAGRVAVAGSFNHWDPFMYRLQPESSRGEHYSLSLDLPRGTHYYYFVVDGRRVPDPHNPQMKKTRDGTYVSVLRVGG